MKEKLKYTLFFIIGIAFLVGVFTLIFHIYFTWKIEWLAIVIFVLMGTALWKTLFQFPYEIVALVKVWQSPKEVLNWRIEHYAQMRSRNMMHLVLERNRNKVLGDDKLEE